MNKLLVSAGLLAAGAASIQTVSAQSLDVISPKAWSVSGTLRGFYDSNYDVSATKKGSYGVEASPSISYNLPLQQTDMGIRYTYGAYYYQSRQNLNENPVDQTHQVDLWLDHAINERWHITFNDTFADGQEPELLTPGLGNAPSVPFRVNGDNLANHATIKLDTQWTREFGTSLHYNNDFYDYANSGTTGTTTTNFSGASLAGLLNQDAQSLGLDLDWTFSPELKTFIGYSFGLDNYLGGETISIVDLPGRDNFPYKSDSRDFYSHNVYVGGEYQLNGNLSAKATVGIEYIDSYNDPVNKSTSWSPTADVSLSYTYMPGSYAQVGVTQGENSTDVVQPGSNGDITQYQYSTVFYADLNHRLTEKLMATLIGRYVYSSFEGGAYSADADNDFNFNANLNYQISRHFSAEIGYNYDDLSSDVPGRAYTRNRVYIGLGANY